MAEIVNVETAKPVVRSLTVKLTVGDVTDLLTYIRTYYKFHGYGTGQAESSGLFKTFNDALTGAKPKLDGMNIANGKVTVF